MKKTLMLCILLAGIVSFSSRSSDSAPEAKKTICVAHRGGAAYAPENTLASFSNAIKMGADMIECDVHLSSDGQVVVIHDDTLDRTSSGKGPVRDKTLQELKKLDAGGWFAEKFRGEQIPTLEEVLKLAKGRAGVIIEIKNGPHYYAGIEEKVLELVKKEKMEENIMIISFDHQCLRKIHELDPRIVTGALYSGNILNCHRIAHDAHSKYVAPDWELVTEETVKDAHSHSIKINVWTINDPDTMKRFIDMGVDCITTNKPDVLLRALGR